MATPAPTLPRVTGRIEFRGDRGLEPRYVTVQGTQDSRGASYLSCGNDARAVYFARGYEAPVAYSTAAPALEVKSSLDLISTLANPVAATLADPSVVNDTLVSGLVKTVVMLPGGAFQATVTPATGDVATLPAIAGANVTYMWDGARWSIVGQGLVSVGPITIPDGTAAAPGLAFSSDLATGIYRPGANSFGISTSGTEAVVVDGNQNLTATNGDIIVSRPANTVAQGFWVETAAAGNGWYFYQPALTESLWLQNLGTAANTDFYFAQGSGNIINGGTGSVRNIDGSAADPSYGFRLDPNSGMYSGGADQLEFATDGTRALRINGAQNVNVTAGNLAVDVGVIQNTDGAVGAPSYTFFSDPNSGVYSAGADQVGIATSGAAGIVVNGAQSLLAYGGVALQTAAPGVTGPNAAVGLFGLDQAVQTLPNTGGAASITTTYTEVTMAAAGAPVPVSLADGTNVGQMKHITRLGGAAVAQTVVITPATYADGTTMTLAASTDGCATFYWNGTAWRTLSAVAGTIA